MTDERPEYNEDIGAVDGRENLWRTVLALAIKEAVTGEGTIGSRYERLTQINEARHYFSTPNDDLNTVCNLAGLDPEAVRERVNRQIASAPSADILAVTKRSRHGSPISPKTSGATA
jgi:hypothetical protein